MKTGRPQEQFSIGSRIKVKDNKIKVKSTILSNSFNVE